MDLSKLNPFYMGAAVWSTVHDNATTRKLNPFYIGAAVWTIALFMYSLGWSDLCRGLDGSLLLFLIFAIAIYLVLGTVLLCKRKKSLTDGSERTNNSTAAIVAITTIVVVIILLGMIYRGSVPILNTMTGRAYDDVSVGVPLIGAFVIALALFHSYRLSFLYFDSHNKIYLIQFIAILLCFLLLYQRQNIAFCSLGFFLAWLTSRGDSLTKKSTRRMVATALCIAGILAAALFVFGVIGNTRYGRWSWNDSSMIAAVGSMNDGWPDWLPKQYFWFYIYMVSPLANLNNNIISISHSGSFLYLMAQLLPSSITARLGFVAQLPFLRQPSLTVGTAFVQPYIGMGFVGVYTFFFATTLLVFFVLACPIKQKSISYAIWTSMTYYLLLMIFDNPSTYLTTAYLMFISIACCIGSYFETRKHCEKDKGH